MTRYEDKESHQQKNITFIRDIGEDVEYVTPRMKNKTKTAIVTDGCVHPAVILNIGIDWNAITEIATDNESVTMR